MHLKFHAGTLLLGLLLIAGPLAAAELPFLRGATYFGNAWPGNFWNSDLDRAGTDFSTLRADGFNTVILVVPWGEFQPGLAPIRYNEEAYRRLSTVCRAARDGGLHVFLRVSYLWDLYPNTELAGRERISSLFSEDRLLTAWEGYLSRIRESTEGCRSGAFISWEDFWTVLEEMANVPPGSKSFDLSERTGFNRWLKHRLASGQSVGALRDVARAGNFPVPARKSVDFALVFEWYDKQFTDRIVSTLSRVIPHAGAEVRVDDDPIYDGEKLVSWFSHRSTYHNAQSPFVMTYWAPAMGARNEGESDSADVVLKRLVAMQNKVRAATDNKIFLEQFLFTDNTPWMKHNATIKPGEVAEFIRKAALPLVRQTAGYALWGAQDYEASLLFNGDFSLGELGWKLNRHASITRKPGSQRLSLRAGGIASQTVPAMRDSFRNYTKDTHLRLHAAGQGDLTIRYGGVTRTVKIRSSKELIEVKFPLVFSDTHLEFACAQGTVELTGVRLYSYTQVTLVRDSFGRPGPHLEAIRKLNRALDEHTAPPSRFVAGEKVFSSVRGTYPAEWGFTKWFAWAGPEVGVTLTAKRPNITVKGRINASQFKPTSSCRITALLNDMKATERVFDKDTAFDLQIPVPSSLQMTAVELRLLSTCAKVPNQVENGRDKRQLSFVLTEIDAGSAPP